MFSKRMLVCSMTLAYVLYGCATGGLTRQDVLRDYAKINELSTGLADADSKESALLAPEAHQKAHALLEEAVEHAARAEKKEALAKAGKGLTILDGMKKDMTMAHKEFSDVLETRERALVEGADALFKRGFEKVDDDLREATALMEGNKLNEARNRRPQLMARYAELEVKALKKGKRKAAEAAIKKAYRMDADKYAPKTYKAAAQALSLVSSVLDADRNNTEKADEHARQAIWLAGRAMDITRLSLIFEENDYELEDIVLWHQAKLDEINKPLKQNLPFDESDTAAVQLIHGSIVALLETLGDMRENSTTQQEKITGLLTKFDEQEALYSKKTTDLLAAHEQQIESWKQKLVSLKNASSSEFAKMQKTARNQLSAVSATYQSELAKQAAVEAEAERKRKVAAQRYLTLQTLFQKGEATVSRSGDDILINAYGFDFPRGSTYIGAKNFTMLNKIVTAINTFPEAKVHVLGHTDSRGNKDRNLRISIERANSVAEFLTTVGNIPSTRVQSDGKGEEAPVASNDNLAGRSKNRRIDILIVNDHETP